MIERSWGCTHCLLAGRPPAPAVAMVDLATVCDSCLVAAWADDIGVPAELVEGELRP